MKSRAIPHKSAPAGMARRFASGEARVSGWPDIGARGRTWRASVRGGGCAFVASAASVAATPERTPEIAA